MSDVNFADWIGIVNLKAAYCRLLDTKDWDAWAELFTEDFEQDVSASGGSVLKGRDTIVASVRSSIGEAKTAHHVHFPEITIDGDTAHAIWPMQDRVIWGEARALTGYGHYHEDYVRQDGRWRIARQKLTRLVMEFDA